MPIRWLADIGADDLAVAGGKGASLGELVAADLPVPAGFVVTADTFRSFVNAAGVEDELYDLLDVDADDPEELSAVAEEARALITGTPVSGEVAAEIREAYANLATETDVEEPYVAVRSSATAEDLPDSSFAGQQDTYLNVTGDALVERVQACWASLFTARAIYYRQTRGFDHADVDVAVVVQHMVDAEKSGVMFTRDPSTGDDRTTIEAAWGLGEGVVSGTVSPDNYVLDADGSLGTERIATKRTMVVREDGETVERDVPDEKQNARVLSDAELDRLVELGDAVEDHYGDPQDVEWAIADGEVFLLQSRPITTIEADDGESEDASAGEDLVSGLGASPGQAVGAARIVTDLDQLDKVGEGDIIVTEMTTPDMVPAMQRAGGLVTDEGGLTSHAAIVSRELGVPAVTGTGDATTTLADGQTVTVDGERGTVSAAEAGAADAEESPAAADGEPEPAAGSVGPMTATEVKVNVSLPAAADRAAATGADGVGLLRLEHMILETGKTPAKYIADHGEAAYVDELVSGIRTVADAFYPRPVRVRTLDAPTDEFRHLEGGEDEPEEYNPMLGYRGVRRSFAEPETFHHELAAFERLYDMGYDNLELMFPLVNDADDAERAVEHMREVGIDPKRRDWGVMVETPSSALVVDGLVGTGIDFVSIGTNDLTQYTLAVDRNNERVADRYEAEHPAVQRLIREVVEACREADVSTSICGEAASQPGMVEFLVETGITSISANIDAVGDVQRRAKRVEQRLLLEAVR